MIRRISWCDSAEHGARIEALLKELDVKSEDEASDE